MSTALFACVHAAEFPAQALLRLRPDLRTEPVVIMDGRPPHEFACSMNRRALTLGVAPGMTRLDVEGLPSVRPLARSQETEIAARAVLLECVSQFSPRIEEASSGTACAFVLDIAGTERLFGAPAQLAERMRAALASSAATVLYHRRADFAGRAVCDRLLPAAPEAMLDDRNAHALA